MSTYVRSRRWLAHWQLLLRLPQPSRRFRNQTRPQISPCEDEILAALGRVQSSEPIARDLGLSGPMVDAQR